ncbi:hypothetical protein V1477_002787 [Vespula maculifrons]|uniref:Uncharacterized protein n=1 Tax=Vespula maculifrons TaxID=7453 RepID=A0ABD2CVS5_VESMC
MLYHCQAYDIKRPYQKVLVYEFRGNRNSSSPISEARRFSATSANRQKSSKTRLWSGIYALGNDLCLSQIENEQNMDEWLLTILLYLQIQWFNVMIF